MPELLTPPAETPVEAPAETLVIVVKQRHIDRGYRLAAHACPVARALREAGYRDVGVARHAVWIGFDEWWSTPELIDWVCEYDMGRPVHPERFVLRRAGVLAWQK